MKLSFVSFQAFCLQPHLHTLENLHFSHHFHGSWDIFSISCLLNFFTKNFNKYQTHHQQFVELFVHVCVRDESKWLQIRDLCCTLRPASLFFYRRKLACLYQLHNCMKIPDSFDLLTFCMLP